MVVSHVQAALAIADGDERAEANATPIVCCPNALPILPIVKSSLAAAVAIGCVAGGEESAAIEVHIERRRIAGRRVGARVDFPK